MEARIATVLRTGVLLAAALLAAGMPWITFRHPLSGRPGPSVGEALRDLPSLHPETLAALGVAVLVATPILQLLTSAVLFWRRRDRLFLALTLVVCAIVGLGATLVGGGG
ncbi:MAG TPA: DUF1634 domain-containing protein [Acidimicrobiia bacterium]